MFHSTPLDQLILNPPMINLRLILTRTFGRDSSNGSRGHGKGQGRGYGHIASICYKLQNLISGSSSKP